MSTAVLISFVGLVGACGDAVSTAVPPLAEHDEVGGEIVSKKTEILDVSQSTCSRNDPRVGKSFTLTTRSHGVRGTVRIVDDCTIAITDFNYDGKGKRVELYGSVAGGSFNDGVALSLDLLRPEKAYKKAILLARLPPSVKLAQLDGLSVWCSDVAVSFADTSLPN